LGNALRVSPYCLGLCGHPDVVTRAIEMEINFFFISTDLHYPLYEPLRQGLRRFLRKRPSSRDNIVVAAVSYVENPLCFAASIPELLISMPELENIDLAIAGACNHATFEGRLPVLRAMRDHSVPPVRSIGATFHNRPAALLALCHGTVDVGFIRYNASHPGAREDLFPFLPKSNRSLLYNFTNSVGYVNNTRWDQLDLAKRGYYRPARDDYYRFVLSRPEISGMLMAARSPKDLERISRAVTSGPVTRDEADYLVDLAALAEGRATLS
jgi:hypothetical protein